MGIEEHLPEGFERRDELARYNTVEDLARAHNELVRKQGSMVTLPQDQDGFKSLMNRLGAPTEASAYTAELPDDELAQLRDAATKAALTPQQFEAIAANRAAALKQSQEAADAQAQALQSQYGDKFEEAKIRALKAKKVLGDDYNEEDPITFALLERLGGYMSDTNVPQPGGAPPPPEKNPADIAHKMRQIMNSDAYNSKRHEEHETALIEYQKLKAELSEFGIHSVFDRRVLGGAPSSVQRLGRDGVSTFDQLSE